MRFVGKYKNGVVVFDQPVTLEDGARVSVEPLPDGRGRPAPGSPEAIRRCNVRWAGDPGELEGLLAEVQRSRDADLTPME